MADRSSQLLLQALSRAAAEAGGVPLFAGRSSPGLFPSNQAGKQAAQRCRDEGFLREDDASQVTLTDKGRAFLLDQTSPRQVLEDFVRVLESREGQLGQLIAQARQMQTSIEEMRRQVAPVLAQVANAPLNDLCRDFHEAPSSPSCLESTACAVCDSLLRWSQDNTSGDCPLPDLFRHTQTRCPALTIGSFHDALRHLESVGLLHLHPWTAPLYAMPEPAFALLAGHVVAYYASSRRISEG